MNVIEKLQQVLSEMFTAKISKLKLATKFDRKMSKKIVKGDSCYNSPDPFVLHIIE